MTGKRSLRFATVAEMPAGMRALVERQQQHAPLPPARMPPAPVQLHPAGATRARHVKHTPGVMNKTEAAYARHLDALIAEGLVSWYGFEVIKLRLADRCWISVDFLVRMKGGGFELHEVKGRKGERYYATEDGKLKVKFTAEKYPFWPVSIVWPKKGGGWGQELQKSGAGA